MPRSAVENAGRILDHRGNSFQARLPLGDFGHIELRWKSDDFSCALATFAADNEMLSTDVILSGLRPEADLNAQQSGQGMIQELCTDAGETVAEGLFQAKERPALICIRWSTKERKGMDMVRDLEICLATAFLERGFQASKWML